MTIIPILSMKFHPNVMHELLTVNQTPLEVLENTFGTCRLRTLSCSARYDSALQYKQFLMRTALLYFANFLRSCSKPGKVLDPTPLPPNLRRQTIPAGHQHRHRMDDLPHHCIRHSRIISVYACGLRLGYLGVRHMHQFASFCLLCSGI